MKKLIAAVCCFFGAWILLSMIPPLRTVLFSAGGFGFTVAILGAVVMAWLVFRAIK